MKKSLAGVTIRTVDAADLREMWEVSYGPAADRRWMAYNGPYFNDPIQSWESYRDGWGQSSMDNPMRGVIEVEGQLVGEVTAYWSDGTLQQWLEIGIVIFKQSSWGRGIGVCALQVWLDYLFESFDYLPHIGFTTWSGNPRMQRLGEKLGMKKEGVIRSVRFWQGEYHDSVKYGILREEWSAEKDRLALQDAGDSKPMQQSQKSLLTQVVAVAGVTAGGKSTLIAALKEGHPEAIVLSFDDYDIDQLPDAPPLGTPLREAVSRYDVSALKQDLEQALALKPALILLDFPFGRKHPALKELISLSVYVKTPLDIALARMILRDQPQDDGGAIRSQLTNYLEFSRSLFKAHDDYIAEGADLLLDGERTLAEKVAAVEAFLQL